MTAATSTHAAAQDAPRTGTVHNRRRFWLTLVAFAVANAAAWAGFIAYSESRRPAALRIEHFSHEDGQTIERRPRLAWSFNFPVAPTKAGDAVGRVSPSVPGSWSWLDPRTLVFTPEADL